MSHKPRHRSTVRYGFPIKHASLEGLYNDMISDVSVFKTSGREAWNEPGPKFTDDLRTVLRQFRTYDKILRSPWLRFTR